VNKQTWVGRGCILALLILATLEGSQGAQLIYTSYSFTTAAGIANLAGYWDAPIGQAAVFHYPGAVAADGQANVYVADTYNDAVRKLTPVGTNWAVTTVATGFNRPSALALDAGGNLYVADTLNSAIKRLTLSGTNWASFTLATNYASMGIAVDGATNVYINDGNAVIVKISPAGVATTLAGLSGVTGTNDGAGTSARFYLPRGLALDLATNLYVADSGNHTIRKITPQGAVTTVAGVPRVAGGVDGTNGTSSVGLFNGPQGVAVDAATNVYVADYNNHTIRRITPGGVVTTLGGLLNLPASLDGAGVESRFNYPAGIAVNNGILYVADSRNDTIRRGIITSPFIVPSSVAFANPHISFFLTGLPGQPVIVQGSTNLSDWVSLWTNTLGPGTLSFTDSRTNLLPKCFYRAAIPR
jgi:sugar lactone lactonase YvrE